jgi:hypothetical protein
LNRSPNILRPLSLNIRFGFFWVVPIVFIVLLLAFQLRGWIGDLVGLTIVASLFSLALAGMWISGFTQSTVLSGIIPLFDAQAYYGDGLRLLAGRTISEFSTARPMFASFLSLILGITNRNLTNTLIILTAINAFACYIAAKEIRSTYGNVAAAFIVIFLFLYYRYRTIGTVMSENLGLPLGIVGTLLIWRGITNKSQRMALIGLFINTVALNTRPGTFFVLPFLLLWGSWYFNDSGNRISIQFFLLGMCAIFMGFGLNMVLVKLAGTPTGVPFSQFSMALYGLASGGNHWSYVFQVYPDLEQLPNPEMTRTIYKLAFELIRDNPILLVRGILRNWTIMFSNSYYNVFSYISGENGIVNVVVRWLLYLLSGLGLVKWLEDKTNPYTSLVIAGLIGFFLSAPFVPSSDAYGMRLYAATILFCGLLPMLGMVFLLDKLKLSNLTQTTPNTTDPQGLTWFSVSLTILILTGPFILRLTTDAAQISNGTCQAGMASIIVRNDPGNSFHLISNKEIALDWLPVFHQGQFARNAHGLPDDKVATWLGKIKAPVTIFSTLDYQSNRAVIVIVPPSVKIPERILIQMCGKWADEGNLKLNYGFFIPEYIN